MMKLPKRLRLGQGVKGPESYGCYNTGLATVIFKSRLLKLYKDTARFAVGPELYIADACRAKVRGRASHKTKHVDGRRVVRFFKNYGQAKKCFWGLVNEVQEERRADVKRVAELKVKAAQGDMQAVCGLGDYM